MDDKNYSPSNGPDKNGKDKTYIWVSEPTNGAKDIVEGNNIVYL